MIRRSRFFIAFVFVCALVTAPACLRVGLWWREDDTQAALARHLEAGNKAMFAERYDEAIREYDSGLALVPGHPSFLVNKSQALRLRGVELYTESFRESGQPADPAMREAAARDLRGAEAVANEAVRQVNAQALAALFQPDDDAEAKEAAYMQRAEALRLLASRFEKSRADEALAAIREYMDVESDEKKRAAAHLSSAQMLLDADRGAQAVEVFREVLAADPDNFEASLGAGLALVNTADPTKYGEAARHLNHFVERAPEDHPRKETVREMIEYVNRVKEPPAAR